MMKQVQSVADWYHGSQW